MDYTADQIKDILQEARTAARQAAEKYFHEQMNGQDQYPCGFAWVNLYGIKGNTKMGRALKQAGVTQDYNKAFKIYNPSGLSVQNVDVKEVGAAAAAAVFTRYGFRAYPNSRLD